MKSASRQIADYIYGFIHDCLPLKNTGSQETIRSYKTSISLYIIFLESVKGIDEKTLSFDCFSGKFIVEWLSWLRMERGCSPASCNNRLAALREFIKYMSMQDRTLMRLRQECNDIHRLKQPHAKVAGLSKKAVGAVLSVPDQKTATGVRDLCLILVLYSLALRIDEALSLQAGDLRLDSDHPFAVIKGKGNKVRTVPIPRKTCLHLKSYLDRLYGQNIDKNSLVFPSRNGDGSQKLSQAAVAKRLRRIAEIAHSTCEEVPMDLHAHQFRHARATHWLDDGVNVVQVSRLLGHADLKTTMIYLDITDEMVSKALEKLESKDEMTATPKWKSSKSRLQVLCGLD